MDMVRCGHIEILSVRNVVGSSLFVLLCVNVAAVCSEGDSVC